MGAPANVREAATRDGQLDIVVQNAEPDEADLEQRQPGAPENNEEDEPGESGDEAAGDDGAVTCEQRWCVFHYMYPWWKCVSATFMGLVIAAVVCGLLYLLCIGMS